MAGIPGIVFTVKNILFGELNVKTPISVNFCILHMKWFLHRKKLENLEPFFREYQFYLRFLMLVEKARYVRKNALNTFTRDYGNIAQGPAFEWPLLL